MLPPFDGQQPFGEHTLRFASLDGTAAHPEPSHDQHRHPGLVEDIEVGLDPRPIVQGQPDEAVAWLPRRVADAEPSHTQRQQQAAVAAVVDGRVSSDGLEAGIEQRRVHAVGALLCAKRPGQRDLGHQSGRVFGGVGGDQTRKGRTQLDPARVEPLP